MLQDWLFWIDLSKVKSCILVGNIEPSNHIVPSFEHLGINTAKKQYDAIEKAAVKTKVDCIYFHYTPTLPSVKKYILLGKDTFLTAEGLVIYWEINRSFFAKLISWAFGLKQDNLSGLTNQESQDIIKKSKFIRIEKLFVYPSVAYPNVISKSKIVLTRFSEWAESSKRNYILSRLLKLNFISHITYLLWPIKLVVLQKNNEE